MLVGVDEYHEKSKASMSAMVGSVTKEASTFKTQLARERPPQELAACFKRFTKNLLEEWLRVRHIFLCTLFIAFIEWS